MEVLIALHLLIVMSIQFSHSYLISLTASRIRPFEIDNWSVNGVDYSGMANTLQDVVDSLNTWILVEIGLYPRLLAIIGGA
ncbi:MAG: hypothetical protein R2784_02180 [Saprospiraceae bacterium]